MNADRYGARRRRATICPPPRLRTTTSCGTHTHDPANRALPQQAMRQARGRACGWWWSTSGRHHGQDHSFGAKNDTTCHLRHPNRDLESQTGLSRADDVHKIVMRTPHGRPRPELDQESTSGGLGQCDSGMTLRADWLADRGTGERARTRGTSHGSVYSVLIFAHVPGKLVRRYSVDAFFSAL